MSFLHPWLLIALLSLPIAYWIIRVIPPPARKRVYPPVRLLQSLAHRREMVSRPAPWLLLLRLTALALMIVGFAQPVWTSNSTGSRLPDTNLVVILDDGAFAVPNWTATRDGLQTIGDSCFAHGHIMTVYRTARDADQRFAPPTTLRDSVSLARYLSRITPVSWATSLIDAVQNVDLAGATVVVAVDGIASKHDFAFVEKLRAARRVFVLQQDVKSLLAITNVQLGNDLINVALARATPTAIDVTIRVENAQRFLLASKNAHLAAGSRTADMTIAIPTVLQRKATRVFVQVKDGQAVGPAAIYLLDQYPPRHPVGLISDRNDQSDTNTPGFYLRHALPLVSELRVAPIDALLSKNFSVIVWPSDIDLTSEARAGLTSWVMQGGTLVRFVHNVGRASDHAGGAASDPLLPVRLSDTLRDLNGVASWEKPQSIVAFAQNSPFAKLQIPTDLSIKKTIIARPDADLPGKIWARLDDGTPLVTGAPLGQGMRVLFHVDSDPSWSDLPLSGLFPDMLQRIIQQSIGAHPPDPTSALKPVQVLDGTGALVSPPERVQPLQKASVKSQSPDASHPPGLYGGAGFERAYNLGPFYPDLHAQAIQGSVIRPNMLGSVRPFGPSMLISGLALLLLDLILRAQRLGHLWLLLLALNCMLHPRPIFAEDMHTKNGAAARATRLAYVLTGDAQTDAVTREGLQGLSNYTSDRTSSMLAPPDGVVPGEDDLAFYPLIYWPINTATQDDPKRNAALNHFINTGGMLMIDVTHDALDTDETQDQKLLARVTRGIAIPALTPLTTQHILAHCFFILHDFPGRVAGRTLWVAKDDDPGLERVSPIIIGSGEWARAWAVDADGHHPYAVMPGDELQRTQAQRFGVNVIIYALTGNYKRDQLLVPELLQRLQPQ